MRMIHAATATNIKRGPGATMRLLGIDIGGTGIKGAPVDLVQGCLDAPRFRLATPQPATPQAVLDTIALVVEHFAWTGPIGCTFPGVVRNGVVKTADHLDPAWVGTDAEKLLTEHFGVPATVVNDADAAALAESRYGAARGQTGMVLVVTLGTGIGTGLVYRGNLIPNSEFGHIEIRGRDAELRASNTARETRKMTWKKWGRHVARYLQALEHLLNPDQIVLGGGIVKSADHFKDQLKTSTPVVFAALGNEAGIVGAALMAATRTDSQGEEPAADTASSPRPPAGDPPPVRTAPATPSPSKPGAAAGSTVRKSSSSVRDPAHGTKARPHR